MKRKKNLMGISKRKALFFGVVLFAWWHFSSAQSNGLNIFQDKDQDGLTDQEELAYGTNPEKADTDGDGYSDGKEVESGYDPLKPAPGDKLVSEPASASSSSQTASTTNANEVNLTEAFIDKIENEKGSDLSVLQTVVNNPELLENESTSESLANVSLTQEELTKMLEGSLSQSSENQPMEMLSEDEIKILPRPEGSSEEEIKSKEKTQIEEYVVAMGYIMLENAPFDASNESELKNETISLASQLGTLLQNGDVSKITEMKEKANASYDKLKALEVPYVLKDVHLKGLSIFHYLMQQDPDSLVDQADPLSMVMSIGKVESAMSEMQTLGTDLETILKEYQIESFSPSEEIKAEVEGE